VFAGTTRIRWNALCGCMNNMIQIECSRMKALFALCVSRNNVF